MFIHSIYPSVSLACSSCSVLVETKAANYNNVYCGQNISCLGIELIAQHYSECDIAFHFRSSNRAFAICHIKGNILLSLYHYRTTHSCASWRRARFNRTQIDGPAGLPHVRACACSGSMALATCEAHANECTRGDTANTPPHALHACTGIRSTTMCHGGPFRSCLAHMWREFEPCA